MLLFGEMGIGNILVVLLLLVCLANLDIVDCMGVGIGLDVVVLVYKIEVLCEVLFKYVGCAELVGE